MSEQVDIAVQLTNQKVQFTGVSTSNPDRPIQFDSYPPVGDGDGFTGLELLLMSFAGCSATSIAYLLRSMKKDVAGLKVNARGIRREQPPTSFEKIWLEFLVHSDDTTESDMQKAIQLAEDVVCPVWAMLKNNVEVITDYKILASSEVEEA
jgi:putative redox protein